MYASEAARSFMGSPSAGSPPADPRFSDSGTLLAARLQHNAFAQNLRQPDSTPAYDPSVFVMPKMAARTAANAANGNSGSLPAINPALTPWHGGYAQPLDQRGAPDLNLDMNPAATMPGAGRDPRSRLVQSGDQMWSRFVQPNLQTTLPGGINASLDYNPLSSPKDVGINARKTWTW